MGLDGPAREIIVEPLKYPEPLPEREPAQPERERETVPEREPIEVD